MSGILAASVGLGSFTAQVLDTTVTTGSGGGAVGYVVSSLGSIGNANFNDGGGNARTVVRITYNAPNLLFRLSGASIPNTDQTFSSIVVNATTFTRSSAGVYDGSADGGTNSSWLWNTGGGGDPWGTNPNNFDIFAVVP